MAQHLCNWTRPVSILPSNKHSLCLLQIHGRLGIFLPLFCFGSPGITHCTSCGSDVLFFELKRDWRYAAFECVCCVAQGNMVFLGAALHWSQLPCCMALPAQTILCILQVNCDAEGTLEKDCALHRNCSYALCPQMLPQCVSACSWFSFHCPTACTKSVPKSNIKVQYKTLIAFLCILLVDKKRYLKDPELFMEATPTSQSEYVSGICFLESRQLSLYINQRNKSKFFLLVY